MKRALAEIRDLRRRLRAAESAVRAPIAVIGMGCRFPGGIENPDALWAALLEGRDCIREVPLDRWDLEGLYDPDSEVPGKVATRWGGFLDSSVDFDPLFFGISPREAMAMDPQQRLLLEVAWEALEDAGQAPDRLRGSSTGVFCGVGGVDFTHLAMSEPPETFDSFLAQGVAHAAASGRVAYFLGLQGPAISLDTACSSSLVAVHLAVRSLRTGETDLALAGGVSTMLTPHMTMGLSRAGMMAADGRCKSFDSRADGFVRSEGCGVAVLKRLQDALRDGDQIWAVILGSACNQDGRSSGMTAPNGPSQEAVIRAALMDAGVDGAQIGYVEAHGTGTVLGDPIEVQALNAALGPGRDSTGPLSLGSVKTNLGHMEAAAGVGGLMKAALCLRHGSIPPHLHFRAPNPHIPWEEIPIDVPVGTVPFPEREGRRLAGVSSFGFTGTNVHLVMESPPRPSRTLPETSRTVSLLKVSAREEGALTELAERYAGALETGHASFSRFCTAAARGRADLPHRMAVVASSAEEATASIRTVLRGDDPAGTFRGVRTDAAPPDLVFLFSGHGTQRPGMGQGLFRSEPVFRDALRECDALLHGLLPRPLLEVMYPEGDEAAARLLAERMIYGQPALFSVQYALVRLWESWGVRPGAVLGHSVGEYAAACEAGVLQLEDALRMVLERGRLFDSLPPGGAMAALFAEDTRVERLVREHGSGVEVAAWNGPTEVVVSGAARGVTAILEAAEAQGIEVRRLAVAQAAHSHLVDPILGPFREFVSRIPFRDPELELISCTAGRPSSGGELGDPEYWIRHLREPVRFSAAIRHLQSEGYSHFMELGPHPVLCGMGARTLPQLDLAWLPSLRRDVDDSWQMLESLAAWYVGGGSVDWDGFLQAGAPAPQASGEGSEGDGEEVRLALPTYPWRHRSYWPGGGSRDQHRTRAHSRKPSWERIVHVARRQQGQAPLGLEVEALAEVWKLLDHLTTGIIADTLRRMDAFSGSGEPETLPSLMDRLEIRSEFGGIVARWLRRMVDAGLVREEPAGFVSQGPLPALRQADWDAAERVPLGAGFLVTYLRRCHGQLPGVLRGRESALETLFPAGETETADLLYRDWSLVRYYNNLMAAVMEEAGRQRPDGAGLRILEVGAGTGGATSALLPAVAPYADVYEFTDVSDLFLDRASVAFGDFDFLRYGILDLNRDPVEAGYPEAAYDVVVGANVLHAADDLPSTLRQLRRLVAPGGLLVAFEVTEYLSWFDVSTALLEGWEGHEDGVRGDHPLLDAGIWKDQLRAAGFEEVASFPEAESPASSFGLHVIVAQAAVERHAGLRGRAQGPASTAEGSRGGRGPGEGTPATRLRGRLEAASPREGEKLLAEFVRDQLRRLLRLDPGEPIDRRRRLMDLGLDSLMAVELRGRLTRGLELPEPLPATLVFDFPTVEAIVGLLTDKVGLGTPDGGAEPPAGLDAVAAVTEGGLDDLSEEEVEARLLERLDSIEGSES